MDFKNPRCAKCDRRWVELHRKDEGKWSKIDWVYAWDAGLCPYCAYTMCSNCEAWYIDHAAEKCLYDATTFKLFDAKQDSRGP